MRYLKEKHFNEYINATLNAAKDKWYLILIKMITLLNVICAIIYIVDITTRISSVLIIEHQKIIFYIIV